MGGVPFPIRGNVVRLFYDPETYKNASTEFYRLMGSEASAVSRFGSGVRTSVHQIPNVYYWRGAVVTYGVTRQGYAIEMHKEGKPETLNELIGLLESGMGVKFKKRTISRASLNNP